MNSNWRYNPETLEFGSKLAFFLSRVTLKFDEWPLKTIGRLFYTIPGFMHHFSHGWIQTGITVRKKTQFGSKSTIVLAVWPRNLTDDLENNRTPLHKEHKAMCIISSSYMNSNSSYGPETTKLGVDLCDLDLWRPFAWTSLLSSPGNNSWKFHEDTMMGT